MTILKTGDIIQWGNGPGLDFCSCIYKVVEGQTSTSDRYKLINIRACRKKTCDEKVGRVLTGINPKIYRKLYMTDAMDRIEE